MNIEHKLEPIWHWIVDGKAYRLATEADVGKDCYRSDTCISEGLKYGVHELKSFYPGEERPYIFGIGWRFAYIQDDSLLTPPTPTTKPIDWTKPVRTKDGRAVRVLCTDGPGDYPVAGYIAGETNPRSWTLDGYLHINERHSTLDLENARQRIQRELWVNVYSDGAVGSLHQTKGLADSATTTSRIACVKITIDCEEGEGL